MFVAHDLISFFLKVNTTSPLYVCTTFSLSSSLSINGYEDSFHLLAIMNTAAIDLNVPILLQDPAFNSLGYTCPEVGFLDHILNFM